MTIFLHLLLFLIFFFLLLNLILSFINYLSMLIHFLKITTPHFALQYFILLPLSNLIIFTIYFTKYRHYLCLIFSFFSSFFPNLHFNQCFYFIIIIIFKNFLHFFLINFFLIGQLNHLMAYFEFKFGYRYFKTNLNHYQIFFSFSFLI